MTSPLRDFLMLAALLGLSGCQRYELDPVEARIFGAVVDHQVIAGAPLPPRVLLVVDKSGSMKESASGVGGACTVSGAPEDAYDPSSKNPCKWNDLKSAIADPARGFLQGARDLAQFGLLLFPQPTPAGDESCQPGKVVLPAAPGQVAAIQELLTKTVPQGGTPSALSLLQALSHPSLAAEENRGRFVILMTDGLPNCNPRHADVCGSSCADKIRCSGCVPTFAGPCDQPFAGAGCLDETGLVDAVTRLHTAGIDTFVIGFGKDTASGDASRVLNASAQAGHRARSGSAGYFQANDVTELRKALEDILKNLQSCSFKLAVAPANPALLQVVRHEVQSGGERTLVKDVDWRFDPASPTTVELLDGSCDEVRAAKPGQLEIKFSYVTSL